MGSANLWLMSPAAPDAGIPDDVNIVAQTTGRAWHLFDCRTPPSQDEVTGAIRGGAPGLVLTGVMHGRDLQMADVMLSVAEAMTELADGTCRIFALPGDNPAGVLNSASLSGKTGRLCALGWDRAALARACGYVIGPHDVLNDLERAARASVVLAAANCGVPAIDTATAEAESAEFSAQCRDASLQGFRGKIARSSSQLEIARAIFGVLEQA